MEFFAGDHFAGAREQGSQQAEGKLLQLHFAATLAQFSALQIGFEGTKADDFADCAGAALMRLFDSMLHSGSTGDLMILPLNR